MNRNNKVCISYDQFKLSPGRYDSSDSGDSSDEEAEEKWEEYFKAEGRATGQASQFTPKRGQNYGLQVNFPRSRLYILNIT